MWRRVQWRWWCSTSRLSLSPSPSHPSRTRAHAYTCACGACRCRSSVFWNGRLQFMYTTTWSWLMSPSLLLSFESTLLLRFPPTHPPARARAQLPRSPHRGQTGGREGGGRKEPLCVSAWTHACACLCVCIGAERLHRCWGVHCVCVVAEVELRSRSVHVHVMPARPRQRIKSEENSKRDGTPEKTRRIDALRAPGVRRPWRRSVMCRGRAASSAALRRALCLRACVRVAAGECGSPASSRGAFHAEAPRAPRALTAHTRVCVCGCVCVGGPCRPRASRAAPCTRAAPSEGVHGQA